MRIVIIASGSRGDVEPYVALGKGLQAAGHVVRLVTHRDFESLVTSYGVDFWPVEGSVQDVAESMAALIENGNFLAILAQMGKEAQRGAVAFGRGSGGLPGHGSDRGRHRRGVRGRRHRREAGTPAAAGVLHPLHAHERIPGLRHPQAAGWLGTLPNRPSYQVARQMMWQPFRSADKQARREVLDLPAAPFFGPFGPNACRASRSSTATARPSSRRPRIGAPTYT